MLKLPAVYLINTAVAACYASGRTTAVVLDIGDQVGFAVLVYEGYVLPHCIQRSDFCGRDATHFVLRQLCDAGLHTTEQEAQELKERFCYVALDYEHALATASFAPAAGFEEPYKLADGRVVPMGGTWRFGGPEALFQPSLIGFSAEGIVGMLYQSIMRSDVDIRRDWYNNILLAGGASLCRGFAERVEIDIAALAPCALRVRVIAPPERGTRNTSYSVQVENSH